MILYGFSIQGKGHIERGIVCQDSNKVKQMKSGHYIGIVADGVGSAAHSDIGSDIAVRSLFQYCNRHVKKGSSLETMKDILLDGYSYALGQIEQYAEGRAAALDDFDTTLSSVIYDGKNIAYGHAGDGGIIIRCLDGSIKPITARQKGADGSSVRPLRAGKSSWAFGTANKVVSVLLVTDGMLDGVIQPVLVNLPPDRMALARGDFQKDNVYVTAAEFFMNPYSVYLNKDIKDPHEYMEYFLTGDLAGEDQKTFLKCIFMAYTKLLDEDDAIEIVGGIKKYFYAVWAVKNVTDDKSVVCMINEKVKAAYQSKKFYEEPNWKWRQESYNALLYGKPMPAAPMDDPLYHAESKENVKKGLSGLSDHEKGREGSDRKVLKWKPDMEDTPFHKENTLKGLESRKILLMVLFAACGVGMFCIIGISVLLEISGSGSKKGETNVTEIRPGISSTKRPIINQEKRMETSVPKTSIETPTLETFIPETEINLKKEAEKFLECLLAINIFTVSRNQKERWNKTVNECGFSDCIKILSENNGPNNVDQNVENSPVPAKGTEQEEMIGIMEKIHKTNKMADFKQVLKDAYDNYGIEGRKKICNTVKEMLQ